MFLRVSTIRPSVVSHNASDPLQTEAPYTTLLPMPSPHCLTVAWFNIFFVFCSLSSSFRPFYLIIPFRHLHFFLQCSHFLPSARTPRSSDNRTCIQGWPLILLLFRTPSWRPQETTSTNYLLSERYGRPLCNVACVPAVVWWGRYLMQTASPPAGSPRSVRVDYEFAT
jgi:hypothetical protein